MVQLPCVSECCCCVLMYKTRLRLNIPAHQAVTPFLHLSPQQKTHILEEERKEKLRSVSLLLLT